jgi:nicotinate-nucleotide pyrophosphorylase (carboxylating)
VPADRRATARLVAQAPGVLSGSRVAARVARRAGLTVRRRRPEGSTLARGTVVLELSGPAGRVLAAERTILNYLMHLSGVASATRAAVAAAGGRLEVLGTRKTVPGLRDLEKAAIVHGGGAPHRRDLSDALLVKRPHLALVGIEPAVRSALAAARGRSPVEVEVASLAEVRAAIDAGARRLLLDNVGPRGARRIVRALEREGRRRGVWIEVSGGITSATLARYRGSGVDAASLGCLTHSAPALPFHLVVVRGGRRVSSAVGRGRSRRRA